MLFPNAASSLPQTDRIEIHMESKEDVLMRDVITLEESYSSWVKDSSLVIRNSNGKEQALQSHSAEPGK